MSCCASSSRFPGSVELRWLEGAPLNVLAQRDVGGLRWNLREAGQWFEGQVDVELAAGQRVALSELLGLLQSNGRFVVLEHGLILALTRELRRRVEQIQRVGVIKKTKFQVPTLAAPTLERILQGSEVKKGADVVDGYLSRIEAASHKLPRIPRTLKAELRDYQREGFRSMVRLGAWGAGALLCDDMGLGKTMQLIALLCSANLGGGFCSPSHIVRSKR